VRHGFSIPSCVGDKTDDKHPTDRQLWHKKNMYCKLAVDIDTYVASLIQLVRINLVSVANR